MMGEERMKIKIYGIRDEERPIAEAWAKKHSVEISLTEQPLTKDTVEEAKGFDGVSNSQIFPLDKEVYPLLKLFGIKQIAQRSAGYDMYDLELASANNIIISNVPSYSPESIAEYTVMVAMTLVRQFEGIRQHVSEQNFAWVPSIRGRVLGDMTIAVIGVGRIGKIVAKIFKGFGCRVVGYEIDPDNRIPDIVDYRNSVEEAVKDADIVTLHMYPSDFNYHQFNAEMFAQFKKGAILMNMARGVLVDTADLLDALDSGQLSAAGIDTYEAEGPYVPKNCQGKAIEDQLFKRLLDHEKVIYTPHTAFYTDEAVKNLVEGGLNAAKEVIESGTTSNRVN